MRRYIGAAAASCAACRVPVPYADQCPLFSELFLEVVVAFWIFGNARRKTASVIDR